MSLLINLALHADVLIKTVMYREQKGSLEIHAPAIFRGFYYAPLPY